MNKMTQTAYHIIGSKVLRFAIATIIYTGFAIYLYQPYFQTLKKWQWHFPLNLCLACSGCYLLSRRWISAFVGSFFAGAVYGFGPFMLGLMKYHPAAGSLAASIPWLFCPAAIIGKTKWRWLSVPLLALPFLVIFMISEISTHYRLFLIPIQIKLSLVDLAGLLAPIVKAEQGTSLISCYHVPIATLLIGLAMLLAAQRFSIITIIGVGLILSLCGHFLSLNVSPIIWLTVPILCFSVLVGVGIQGILYAGFADRKWILLVAIIMGILAIVTLLLATKYFQIFLGLGARYAILFTETAKMYIVGAIALAVIFFIIQAKLRLHWLRWIILCSAMTIDIFFGATFIIDKIL